MQRGTEFISSLGSALEGEPLLNFLRKGGLPVKDSDIGYGPARFFRSEDVVRIHEALQKISSKKFAASYNSQKLNEEGIYPAGWNGKDPNYLIKWFESVKQHFSRLVKESKGCVITLS